MRRRVLYVDDTPSSRDALREYCTRELPGVDLITAATASEGSKSVPIERSIAS